MSIFTRRSAEREKWGDRLPPGQKDTGDGWPVLHYGGVPRVDTEGWRFEVGGLVDEPVVWTWEQFKALPQTRLTSDIHCVTAWSKFDNDWEGVLFKDVYARIKPKEGAKHVMVHSFGGYTTNVPLDELLDGKSWVAFEFDGEPLDPEHGWPLRLVVPHLYFWKSAKWVRGLVFMDQEKPGFWEMYGYHIRGDPWKEERYS
jgi:DMSO/TMAO reductase YedYZ molybdopterin-dependent catalytic subunit